MSNLTVSLFWHISTFSAGVSMEIQQTRPIGDVTEDERNKRESRTLKCLMPVCLDCCYYREETTLASMRHHLPTSTLVSAATITAVLCCRSFPTNPPTTTPHAQYPGATQTHKHTLASVFPFCVFCSLLDIAEPWDKGFCFCFLVCLLFVFTGARWLFFLPFSFCH